MVLVKVIRKVNIMGLLSKVVKEGVKRGRKSKRGRKPNKVKEEEAKKKQINKKGAAVFPQPAKETKVYTKKEKKEIKQIRRAQERDIASETGKSSAGGKRDSRGRLLSKHIPPSREEMGDEAFARRVIQGLIGKTKDGKVKDIGKYAVTPEEIMDILYNRLGRKPSKSEIKELIESGFSIKKSGGPIVKRKTGGTLVKRKSGGQIGSPRGVGAALRGFGKGYK